MNLTDEEKAVVKAMRLGGNVEINFYHLKELEEVDEVVNLFKAFNQERFMSMTFEMKSGKIAFLNNFNHFEISCYLDIKKA